MNRIKNSLRLNEIDPESRNRVLFIGGMVAIVVVALGLIAVGYYVDRIAPRGDTVFTVAEREFSYAYLEDRVNAANAEGVLNRNNLALGIAQTVSDIQNEELTRLIAEEEGITLTKEELEQGMRDQLGVSPQADRNVFAAALRSRLQLLGLSLDRYEEMVEASVLEQKIQERIEAGLPAEMDQVDLHLILVETDAAAANARQRIVDGEEFAVVAEELSTHSSAPDGGALGWTPADLLLEDLAEAAFAQEPGTLSEIIETERGFYILRVDGKETRELDEQQRVTLVRTYFGDRLEAAAEQYEMENMLTVEQAQRIANQLQVSGG